MPVERISAKILKNEDNTFFVDGKKGKFKTFFSANISTNFSFEEISVIEKSYGTFDKVVEMAKEVVSKESKSNNDGMISTSTYSKLSQESVSAVVFIIRRDYL